MGEIDRLVVLIVSNPTLDVGIVQTNYTTRRDSVEDQTPLKQESKTKGCCAARVLNREPRTSLHLQVDRKARLANRVSRLLNKK